MKSPLLELQFQFSSPKELTSSPLRKSLSDTSGVKATQLIKIIHWRSSEIFLKLRPLSCALVLPENGVVFDLNEVCVE